MEMLLPFALLCLLMAIHIVMFKRLCTYLAVTYPEKWQQLVRPEGGMPSRPAMNNSLKHALESGHFSDLADPTIARFKLLRTINSACIVAVILFGFIQALIY